jgi:2-polyprenyl-6-methoxyphenol hydroxylase-like FAD-dependent oxidoreductase
MPNRRILISGAGIAGPVLAWWLTRNGFRPTIVESAPELRSGGHPVDLWGSVVTIMERMGILPEIEAACTRNDRGVMHAYGRKPLEIDLSRISTEFADRQVEIMRGELVSILYECTKAGTDYVFGNSIAAIDEQDDRVRVTFEKGGASDFSLVIGADGQHSNVRRLVFGQEERFSRYIGGYICGYTIPNVLGIGGTIHRYVAPNKTVAVFPIRQSGELGVGFLFRSREPFGLHHDDVDGQKRLLREIFDNEGWEVPRLLQSVEDARYFYFDAFSQIHMESYTKGRIALVGDAGYCPAPAVGGGTSLAVVGAYTLAHRIAQAAGDHRLGLHNYELDMRDVVIKSREIGPALVKTLIPSTEMAISLSFFLGPLVMALPDSVRRWLPVLPRRAVNGMRAIAEAAIESDGR